MMNGNVERLNGFDALIEAIRTVPVPGAPTPTSRDGAAVGLAFLDMALRQNHIRRMTERLSIVEHRSATRTTEVDVRLSLLTKGQREASDLFQKLTSRSIAAEDSNGTSPGIWVPITRISRQSVSPIDAVDGAGNKLPRLTQYETSRLLAAGLYRLLRGILLSHPESRQDTDLGRFLYKIEESRWLVQGALVALLLSRTRPLTKRDEAPGGGEAPAGGRAPDGREGPVERFDQYRDFAISVLTTYRESLLETYVRLLDVAVNDYLLVVALDRTKDDHLLSYDSPVHLPTRQRRAQAFLAWLSPAWTSYRVEYRAQIPSGLRSYHVVAETELGVHIEDMSLVTNTDEEATQELAGDLETLATALDSDYSRGRDARVLELELQSALGRLAELLRSRRWDANQANLPMTPDRFPEGSKLVAIYQTGPGSVDASGRFHSTLLRSAGITAASLRAAAREITEKEVALDFALENDPASNRAHAYWRRSSARAPLGGHTRVTCALRLRDATGARPGSVVGYAIAVAATVYVAGCFLTGKLWPYHDPIEVRNADALVAVLLLVPGFLYTRLDLPRRDTILGRLRAWSRQIAHLCIAAAVALAAAIAADVPGAGLRWLFLAGTVVPALASLLLVWQSVWYRKLAPDRSAAPRWLRGSGRFQLTPPADAVFYSSGSDHD